MKTIIPLFFLSLIFSCKHESKFDLEKDLYQFSEKMENEDTVEVNVNHSACLFLSHETYTFSKQNDTVFLKTHSEINSFENRKQDVQKRIYNFQSLGQLSFENYFKYLKKEDKPKTDINSPIVILNYKNKAQSKAFYNDGLEDKFNKLDQFALIRKRIYPNDTFFESPEPPPPPPSIK